MLTFVVVVLAVFYFVFFFVAVVGCLFLFLPLVYVHMPIGWKEWDAPVLFQSSLSSRSQTKIYIKGFPELLSGFILIGSRQRSDKFVSLKKSEDFQFGGVNVVTLSMQFQQIMGLINYSSMAVRSVLPLI